jgi:hypothetical protein
MKKLIVLLFAMALLASLVYGITLTADATRSVHVPAAALGRICFVASDTGDCTDKVGEILFGNAVVESMGGDRIGMILIQFGGNIYRSTTTGPVYLYRVTMTDGSVLEKTDLPESGLESYEPIRMVGLRGRLSQVLPDGTEVITTGETRTLSHPGKISVDEDVPVGEYDIRYSGLVLEDTETSRQVMTAGEYEDIQITINAPGGVMDKYKLVEIVSTTSFDWSPSTPK